MESLSKETKDTKKNQMRIFVVAVLGFELGPSP
jgi:hypothetical protein